MPYPPPGQSGCLAPVGRAACCCPFCCLPAAAAGATPALAQSTKTFQPCATLQTNRRLLPSSGRIPAPSSPRGLQIARRHRSVFCKLLLPAASRPFAPHGCPWQCPPFRHCAACSGLYLVSCSGSWSYVQNAVATTSSLPLRLFLPAGLRPAPTWVRTPRAPSWALCRPTPASRLCPAVPAPRCCGGLLRWPVSAALGDTTACALPPVALCLGVCTSMRSLFRNEFATTNWHCCFPASPPCCTPATALVCRMAALCCCCAMEAATDVLCCCCHLCCGT